MAKTRKLQVEILGDAKSLERAFGKSQNSSSKLSKSLGKLGGAALKMAKYAAIGGAALVGMTAAIGVKGLIADEQAINKVNSALKSTKGAAKISSKAIQDHAGKLQALTGIGADQIMTQQSILLSFTKVRNEVGKGNAVFDRGTEAIVDMSLALGTDTGCSVAVVVTSGVVGSSLIAVDLTVASPVTAQQFRRGRHRRLEGDVLRLPRHGRARSGLVLRRGGDRAARQVARDQAGPLAGPHRGARRAARRPPARLPGGAPHRHQRQDVHGAHRGDPRARPGAARLPGTLLFGSARG